MCNKLVGNRPSLSSASPYLRAGAYVTLDRIVRGNFSNGGQCDGDNGDWKENALELADMFSVNGLPPKGQGERHAGWREGKLSALSVCVYADVKYKHCFHMAI